VGELAVWTYKRYGSKNPISPALYKEKIKMTLINNGAGTAGGIAGAAGGAYLGAFIGSFAGPVGAAIGATIGAIIGGITGGVGAAVVADYMFADHALVEAEAAKMGQEENYKVMCKRLGVGANA
jgi:phage tail tape-measure protein